MSSGLSTADWLLQGGAVTQDKTNSRRNDNGCQEEGGGCVDGGGGECEVVTPDLDHPTVTISEDVTITSLPLTQLPPIHLQLESKSTLFACHYNLCVTKISSLTKSPSLCMMMVWYYR